MSNDKFGFEDLEIWKKTRLFKLEILRLAQKFPTSEKFRLTDQITRSVRSINALIAEGHGRFSYPDQIHYCIQARGSLSETINHLIDAFDEEYINQITLSDLSKTGKEIERMINGYIIFLRKKRDELK